MLTMFFMQSLAALANWKYLPFAYLQHHDTQNTLLKAALLLSRNKEKITEQPTAPTEGWSMFSRSQDFSILFPC